MLWTDPFAPFLIHGRTPGFLPAADVALSDGDMVLTLDLPGLTADELEIELRDTFLTVRGERRRPDVAEGTTWAHSERAFGRFERRIRVPEGVDPERITASMSDGVLSLIVPKPERIKPKTIAISARPAAREEQRELEGASA